MSHQGTGEGIIELAKTLLEYMPEMSPDWETAFYRFYETGNELGGNGSYVDPRGVHIMRAIAHREFFVLMNKIAEGVFSSMGKSRGVLLLTANNTFEYDVKFEFDDLDRWRITKLDGSSGLPS